MSIFASQRQLNKANSLTATVIVVIISLVLNIFSAQLFARWDATADKNYSLSSTTKDMLKDLPDVVNVKAYFTASLPGYLVNTNRDVRDLLGEIETSSGGNVLVTYFDPNKDEKVEQEARGLGIPTLQFNVVEKDQYQVTNGYLGIAVLYGDSKEIIPLVQDTSSLEYDIAAAISKVTREEVPKVAFLKGRKAFTRDADLTQVAQLIERQYDVSDYDVTTGDLVPDNINTLIIPGVREQLTKREQYSIDQFL
ncbi:MAG: GldG family protein, partial [Patescibacteria group bacterium]